MSQGVEMCDKVSDRNMDDMERSKSKILAHDARSKVSKESYVMGTGTSVGSSGVHARAAWTMLLHVICHDGVG